MKTPDKTIIEALKNLPVNIAKPANFDPAPRGKTIYRWWGDQMNVVYGTVVPGGYLVHSPAQAGGIMSYVDLKFDVNVVGTMRWAVDVQNISDQGVAGDNKVVYFICVMDTTTNIPINGGVDEDFGTNLDKDPAVRKQSDWQTASAVATSVNVRMQAGHGIRTLLYSYGYADVYSLGLVWEVDPE